MIDCHCWWRETVTETECLRNFVVAYKYTKKHFLVALDQYAFFMEMAYNTADDTYLIHPLAGMWNFTNKGIILGTLCMPCLVVLHHDGVISSFLQSKVSTFN